MRRSRKARLGASQKSWGPMIHKTVPLLPLKQILLLKIVMVPHGEEEAKEGPGESVLFFSAAAH